LGLIKGLEQAGDTRLPSICLSRTLKEGLAMLPDADRHAERVITDLPSHMSNGTVIPSKLPWGVSQLVESSSEEAQYDEKHCLSHMSGGSVRVVAHPQPASPSLLAHLLACAQSGGAKQQHVTLAVGPEGGWREAELEELKNHGFACVHLGDRVLTTTTALITAVGTIHAAQRLHAGGPGSQ